MPVTVDTDLPLHDDRGREWDGDAARSAMARRCAGSDGVMADCMGDGFIWQDPEADASTIGAYDLPVADVFDGDLHLVLSGVQAAANSISPERTPGEARALDAPESDLSRMRGAVETILARFAAEFDDETIRAPWDEPTESETASAQGGCSCACGGSSSNDQTSSAETDTNHDEAEEATMPDAPAAPVPAQRSRVLRASATGGDWRPVSAHFANPHLTEATKLTVTADGHVYGHLATWDQPHIGYDGKLVYPPKNSSGAYEYFRQSAVVADGGEVVPVGIITMNTGHADESMSADAAASHYDNTGTMVAAVNVGEDALGIWLAGSMLPDVSPELRTRFSLARVSGDWRQPRPGSGLELIAALSVPNPGFPVRQSPDVLAADRLSLAASGLVQGDAGEIRTFICAGATVVDQAQQAALTEAVRSALGEDFVNSLKTAVVDAIRAEAAAEATSAAPPAPEAAGAPPSTGGEESQPAVEGEPSGDGEAEPAPTPVPVTDAGAATASPAEAAEPAAAVAAPPAAEAAQVAASALADRVRKVRARGARERLLAAAGAGKKA